MLLALFLRIVHAAYLTHVAALECARRLRLHLVRSVALPARTPQHVGIVVGGVEPVHLQQLAALIAWVAATGVRCVTICDMHGELQRNFADFPAALAKVQQGAAAVMLEPGEVLRAAHGDELAVRVAAMRTGRDDITVAARRLCEQVHASKLSASSIDEAAVESELRANAGFPEPVRAQPQACSAASSARCAHTPPLRCCSHERCARSSLRLTRVRTRGHM